MANGTVREVPVGRREDDVAAVFDDDCQVALTEWTAPVEPRIWDDLDGDAGALLDLADEVLERWAETVEVLGLHGRGIVGLTRFVAG